MWGTAPPEVTYSFWERGHFSLKCLQAWSLFYSPLESTLVHECVFLSLFSCNFDDQLSQKILLFWETQCDNTVLWQLPKVSSGLKRECRTDIFYTDGNCFSNFWYVIWYLKKRKENLDFCLQAPTKFVDHHFRTRSLWLQLYPLHIQYALGKKAKI